MSDLSWYVVLRAMHIVVGVFWVGTALFTAGFLIPSIRAAGPAGGEVMRQLVTRRHLPRYLEAATILTLVSGVVMYWQVSSGFQPAWLETGPGTTFGIGGLLGLAAAVVGFTVNAPAAKRMGSLAASIGSSGGPPSADQASELQRLQHRILRGAQAGAVLLLLSTLAMAVARHVR
jgi:uncharacterized membrane protein